MNTAGKRNRVLLGRTMSGAFGQLLAPDFMVYRRAIESQTCPWCGRSGFRSLTGHTYAKHGVSAADLRTLAKLGKQAPTCDPKWSAELSARREGQRPEHLFSAEVRAKALATPRVLSEFGFESQKRKAALVSDDQRRAALEKARPAGIAAKRAMPIRHGETAGYGRGCRCDACRKANTDAHRAYLAKKRAETP